MTEPLGGETLEAIMRAMAEASAVKGSEPSTVDKKLDTLEEGAGEDDSLLDLLRKVTGSFEEVDSSRELDIAIGRFKLKRLLGQGGFGMVFLASDPILGREVALKLPNPHDWFSAERHSRFLRESQTAAGLDHPNIIPIYEAGRLGLLHYQASAYCAGPSLAAWLGERSDPMPPRLAATWVAQLADAVQHAHQHGVLHRDIKPANILLDPNPSAPGGHVPRLADFGLAKFIDAGADLTHSRAVVGTPRYMSPEQARGDSKAMSTATDVFCLGVILYELLAGEPPFEGSNDAEILRRVAEEEPRNLRRSNGRVDRDIEAICLRCLENAPARRYRSAGDLADDLRSWLSGLPVKARRVSAPVHFARWCRRRPGLATLSLGLATSIIAGFALVTWQWRQSEYHLAKAQRQSELLLALVQTGFLWRAPETGGSEGTSLEDRQRVLEEIKQAVGGGEVRASIDLAKLFSHSGRLRINIGQVDDGLADYLRSISILESLERESPGDLRSRHAHVGALLDYATNLASVGRIEVAIRQVERAVDRLEKFEMTGLGERHLWRRIMSLAETIINRSADAGQLDHALALANALASPTRWLAERHPGEAWTEEIRAKQRFLAGLTLHKLGSMEPNLSLATFREAIDLNERVLARNPGLLDYRIELASTYDYLCRLYLGPLKNAPGASGHALAAADSIRSHLDTALADKAITLDKKISAADRLARLAGAYAVLRMPKRVKEVGALGQLVAADCLRAAPSNPKLRRLPPLLAMSMGQADIAVRDMASAERLYSSAKSDWEALEMGKTLDPKDRYQLGETYYQLGLLRGRHGDAPEALALLAKAETTFAKCEARGNRAADVKKKLMEIAKAWEAIKAGGPTVDAAPRR